MGLPETRSIPNPPNTNPVAVVVMEVSIASALVGANALLYSSGSALASNPEYSNTCNPTSPIPAGSVIVTVVAPPAQFHAYHIRISDLYVLTHDSSDIALPTTYHVFPLVSEMVGVSAGQLVPDKLLDHSAVTINRLPAVGADVYALEAPG